MPSKESSLRPNFGLVFIILLTLPLDKSEIGMDMHQIKRLNDPDSGWVNPVRIRFELSGCGHHMEELVLFRL